MANIIVQHDPYGIRFDNHKTTGSNNLLDWMLANLPVDMGLHCEITLNGRVLASTATMSVDQCNHATDISIGDFDSVKIVFRPQGLDPFTWAIIAIVAIGSAVYLRSMIPKPNLPGVQDPRDSNNQLNAARNAYRPRLAIPDIAGQIVSYPDFIQPSYYVYEQNQRVFTEWFCFGFGRYEIGPIKEGETSFADVPGNSAQVFGPGESVGQLLNVRTSESSVDVELVRAEAQSRTIYIDPYDRVSVAAPSSIYLTGNLFSTLALTVGTTLDFELTVMTVDGMQNYESGVSVAVTALNPNTGLVEVDHPFVENGSVVNGYMLNTSYQYSVPWYVLEGDAVTEVWFNLVMPQGIKKADNTIAIVAFTLEIELLSSTGQPTGTKYQRGGQFVGNSQSPQRQTFKITSSDGMQPGRYRARASRITASLGENSIDMLVLEGVSSVTPYAPNFGDVTALKVQRSSAQRVNKGSSDKINALVTRKLRIYNPATGEYSSTYHATRRFCDYAFYLLHERMGVPIEQINTAELFGITDNLSDPQLGYFDFSFADGNVSARERLEACCNVARVRYWNEGLTWSFVCIEAKPVKSLMFNRRNLKAGASTYVQSFRRPADYDSVTVVYVDPVKNAEKQISRRINSAGQIVPGVGIRSNEIKLNGCRNDLQALNRCELEVRRLIYENVRVTDTALNDGQLCRLGQRIDWIDILDGDLFDGEVLAISGNTYSTSERFTPVSGVEYWVYITDDQGNPSNSVRCSPVAGNQFAFNAAGLTGAFLAGGTLQVGSRYVIASNNDMNASSFTVAGRGRPNERGECEIELAEYHPEMFEAD